MIETDTFIRANQELLPVIESLTAEQMKLAVPAEMTWQPNQTVRDLVNYHAYDDAWVPDTLSGKTIAEVGAAYDALKTAVDSQAEYRKYNQRAIDAVREFADFDHTVHLSYGDFPAKDYLQHISMYRGFRVYDISKLIGKPVELSPELVKALWEILEPQAEALRAMHVFGPEVVVAKAAPLFDRLLGLSGRQPVASR